MRRTERAGRFLALACLCVVALVAGTADAAPETGDLEAAAVRRGFDTYEAALRSRDGKRAVGAVSHNSLVYYDRIRKLALSGTREELAALDGTERWVVLGMRRDAPIELLKGAAPSGLVSHAVDNGLISDQDVVKMELGEVAVESDVALATIVVDGTPTEGKLRFLREQDVWKFDLEFAMRSSYGLVAMIAQHSGISEDEVIFRLLAQGEGGVPGPEIWTPLVPVSDGE